MKSRKNFIQIVFCVSMVFILSSCMMMTPAHTSHSSYNSNNARYSDPVCGITIDANQPNLRYQYNGTTYFFHSADCLNQFRQSPDDYISKTHHRYNTHSGFMWVVGGAIVTAAMMLIMII